MKKCMVCMLLFTMVMVTHVSFAQEQRGCDIKGITAANGQKAYLLPGHTLYDQIGVRTEEGERWFCTIQEAEKAGYIFLPDPNNPQLKPPTPTPQPVPTPLPTRDQGEESIQPVEEEPSGGGEEEARPTQEREPTQEPEPGQWEQPETEVYEMPQGYGMPQGNMPLSARILMSLPPGMLPVIGIGALVFVLLMIISMWVIFSKADQPGFGAIIPIYYNILRFRVAGMSGWWFLSLFIPVLGWIIWFLIVPFKTADNFGKGFLYALGLIFLPFVFYPHLAFSSAEYVG